MIFTVGILFFVLPLLAGGTVRLLKPDPKWLRLLLSFSGAFLLGVVFLHMLPELYHHVGTGIGLWVLAGLAKGDSKLVARVSSTDICTSMERMEKRCP